MLIPDILFTQFVEKVIIVLPVLSNTIHFNDIFQDFVLPADVAFPVGGPGAPSYLVMETHYDNPGLSSGIVDVFAVYSKLLRTTHC